MEKTVKIDVEIFTLLEGLGDAARRADGFGKIGFGGIGAYVAGLDLGDARRGGGRFQRIDALHDFALPIRNVDVQSRAEIKGDVDIRQSMDLEHLRVHLGAERAVLATTLVVAYGRRGKGARNAGISAVCRPGKIGSRRDDITVARSSVS